MKSMENSSPHRIGPLQGKIKQETNKINLLTLFCGMSLYSKGLFYSDFTFNIHSFSSEQ